MRNILTVCMAVCLCTLLQAQDLSDKIAVRQVVDELFDGMRTGNGTQVINTFLADAILKNVSIDQNGKTSVQKTSMKDFGDAISRPRNETWNEVLWTYDIKIDGALAYVWTDYSFFRNTTFSHCGINMFELIKTNNVWKIAGVTDTRRTTDCVKDLNAAPCTKESGSTTTTQGKYLPQSQSGNTGSSGNSGIPDAFPDKTSTNQDKTTSQPSGRTTVYTPRYEDSNQSIKGRNIVYRDINGVVDLLKTREIALGHVVATVCIDRKGIVKYVDVSDYETSVRDKQVISSVIESLTTYKFAPKINGASEECEKLSIRLGSSR